MSEVAQEVMRLLPNGLIVVASAGSEAEDAFQVTEVMFVAPEVDPSPRGDCE